MLLNALKQTPSLTVVFFRDSWSEWSHSLELAVSPTYVKQIANIIKNSCWILCIEIKKRLKCINNVITYFSKKISNSLSVKNFQVPKYGSEIFRLIVYWVRFQMKPGFLVMVCVSNVDTPLLILSKYLLKKIIWILFSV